MAIHDKLPGVKVVILINGKPAEKHVDEGPALDVL